MQVRGSYRFPTSPHEVWAVLLDGAALRACVPGIESLTESGADRWEAVLSLRVGAIAGTYQGNLAITDRSEPHSYALRIEGTGGPGHVSGTARVALTPDGSETVVSVEADAQVGGPIAGVGQRLLSGVARMLMDRCFECLRARTATQVAGGE